MPPLLRHRPAEGGEPLPTRRGSMGRPRHILSLAVWAAAGLVVHRFSSGALWVGPSAGRVEARTSRIGCRAIIPRPIGGPILKRRLPYDYRKHIPVGMKRLPGPLRYVPFQKNVTATLVDAVDPYGRGGLRDRYRDEMKEHLAEMAALREKGTPMEATIFWDFENMNLFEKYQIDPYREMHKFLEWAAGMIDAPVTSVEAVEFTRHGRTPEGEYIDGKRNWHMTLREIGGIVHRAWPKMTDAADVVLIDRMRTFLDKIKDGGPQRILCLLSGDKGFYPMLQAAQSEGVTVVVLTSRDEGHYFPGGKNFTVGMSMKTWDWTRMQIQDKKLDIFRPDEERTLEQGPREFFPGTVELRHEPQEELDRRCLPGFVPRTKYLPARASFNGQWVRKGLRLNDTLVAAMQRALARTGTMGTRTGRLKPEAHAAVTKDLEELSMGLAEDSAAVFWNFETMKLSLEGPSQMEMVARFVRWNEGFLGMPVQRLEASKYVEPWDRIGASPHDWLYAMSKVGTYIHRVWPPRAEMTNMALMRSVGAFAKAAAGRKAGKDIDMRLPRLICVFAEDLYFDEQMRAAQRAGISAFWFGPESRGIYFPANSDVRVRLEVLDWRTIMKEISVAVVNPFLPGAWTPDAPPPRYQKTPLPVNVKWGAADELELDSAEIRIPEEVLQSRVGIGF